MSMRSVLLGSAMGAAALAAGIVPASAQQGASAPQLAQGPALEEIVVTARKREETLQDAPLAVTAFTDQAFDNLNIRNTEDIARFTPGLSISAYVGRRGDRPVIRGQSNVLAQVQFGVESGTAYFIDGVYYSGSLTAIDLEDMDRVEVIKGPQSALYGRNTYAGAINFVTRQPGNEFDGKVEAEIATEGLYEATASVRGPIIPDQLFFNLSGRFYEYEGEFENSLTGNPIGNERTVSGSGALTWLPTPDLEIKARTQYSADRDGHSPIYVQNSDFNNCSEGAVSNQNYSRFPGFALPAFLRTYGTNPFQYYCGVVPPQDDAFIVREDDLPWIGTDRDLWFSSLRADYDIGGSGYVATLSGGFTDLDDSYVADSEGNDSGPGILGAFSRTELQEYSIEARVASPEDNAFRWLAGAFYFDNEEEVRDITPASGPDGLPIAGIETTIENYAFFGLAEYDFNDRTTLTGEIRWASEEKTRGEFDETTGAQTLNQEGTFYSITPRFTLSYDATGLAFADSADGLNLYAVYAQGTKPGGLNGAQGRDAGSATYSQEKSDNFELGAKTTWFGGRFQANVAGYFIDAQDVQLTTSVPSVGTGGTTSIATNQGSAEIYGLEIELQAVPMDGLTVGASYSWTDATFTEGCDEWEYTLNSGGLAPPAPGSFSATDFALCDIAGNQLPLTSEHQASANVRWQQPLFGEFDYYLSGDVTYEGSKFAQVHNRAETGDSTLVGAQIGVVSENIEFVVFGRNLTDEDAVINITRWFDTRFANFSPAGLINQQPGARFSPLGPRGFFVTPRQGRTFGARAAYRF